MNNRRIGPILLSPGVTPAQICIFLLVISTALCLLKIVGVVQPYLFTEVMHVPASEQGRLTGLLNMVQYAAVALVIIPVGTLADRYGRKPVLLLGIAGFSGIMVLLPLASSIGAVVALRFLFGVASTGHTVGGATMIIDYPANESRGKFVSLMIAIQALVAATLVGQVVPEIPALLMARGVARDVATHYALWVVAGIGVLGLLLGVFALASPPRLPRPVALGKGWQGILASSRQIFALCRSDPGFSVVVLVSFVVRADYFVTASFLSVWIMNASKAQGIDASIALRTAGTMFTILTVMVAISPLAFGYLADKVNRVGLLIGSLVFGAFAFFMTALVHDVSGWMMIGVVGLIGAAESAQAVASQAVFGDRAPAELRGSAWGFFILMGTFSVIVVSYLGGFLYDKVGYIAPFMFLAVLNVVFAVAAVLLIVLRGRR